MYNKQGKQLNKETKKKFEKLKLNHFGATITEKNKRQ
jgi:hypothetical protein